MNVRLSLLLVLVLILVGGAVFLSQELSTKEPTQRLQPWLYRIDQAEINYVSVVHEGERMDYALSGDSDWVIKDGFDSPVFIDKWAGKTLLLSGPSSSRALTDQIDDPAKYGLDAPETEISVSVKSGQVFQVFLGDLTPDLKNQYARLVGSDELFTVASLWGEDIVRLVTEPPQKPQAHLYNMDPEDILHVSITHRGKQVEYEVSEDGTWVIKDGSDTPVSEDKWAGVPLLLSRPPKGPQLETEIDDPALYGLDTPLLEVAIQGTGDQSIEVHFGSKLPKRPNVYALIVGSDGLFSVPSVWGETVSKLVTDPPYPPSQEPPEEGAVSEQEDTSPEGLASAETE